MTAYLTKSCHFDIFLIYYGAMGKSIPPISEKTFSHFCGFIDDVIKRIENGSVIGLNRREQSYRINQLTKNKSSKIIDLKSYFLDDPEDLKLPNVNSNDKTAYLITNADSLFEEKQSFLAFFNNLVKKNSKFSLIFFFQHNITYPWNMKVLSSYQYLFQNIYFYPKYEKDDLKQFLIYLGNKFKNKIPTNTKNLILSHCGGNLWLIKEAVRYYVKTKDIKNIFDHQEMIFRLKVIYDELEEQEKRVFKKLIKQEANFTDDEKLVIDYLNKTNYISPLLKKFVSQKLAYENFLSLNQNNIILNSIPIDYFFSRSERKGLRYLLSFSNKLITRDELAKTLWSGNDDYTDWALDQFIKRLRNKLIKLGLDRQLIKTKKNQGFVLINSFINL